VPTPIVAGDLVIVTGGYPAGGRPIYAIKPGGSGTLAKSALAWQTERGSPYTGTPLVHDNILYVCTDNGILSTYDVKTGERFYQQRVSAEAAGFSASPIAAGDRLYLASEEGDVFVVQAGRAFKLLATNRMGEITMATPAVAGNMLVVRTQSQLVGIRAS
jgi:outer membrane protein assembly factor BamB